jgi:hypothetical protein
VAGAAPAHPRTAEDAASIDSIVAALYDGLSGPPGPRDWDRLRALYLPGARLIPTGVRPLGEGGVNVMDVETYVATTGPFFLTEGFWEREVARRVERFGSVAHVFSTYASFRRPEDAEPFMRGINSIQLLHREGRWWVVTVLWENETEAVRIPPEYLP